ncbi:hypothetical protein AB3S75_035624 [Citrus x aurantiifolia]
MAFSGVHRDRGELRIHESVEELSTNLADYIADLSEASVKERGVFAIALSGGSLIGLMGKLCEAPYNKTVDWAKWYIFWADERVVAKNHADSNYKLAKEGLLSKVPIVPSHVHSINDSLSAEEAGDEYEFDIRQLVKARMVCVSDISDCPKFDLILLGMGSDGHVASLFPNHSVLDVKNQWVRARQRLCTWRLMTLDLIAHHCQHEWSSQQMGSWYGFWTSRLPQNSKVFNFVSRVKAILAQVYVCM